MASFFANRTLSRGDLTLFLRNALGLPQDGFDVRWTVFRKNGLLASGSRIPATKASTGEYFAPWGCADQGGCYHIRWEYSDAPGGPRERFTQDFFVLESDGCCSSICSSSAPVGPPFPIHCGAFFIGQQLGPDDLVLHIEDDDGLPSQAFLVFFSIFDCNGLPIVMRGQASPGAHVGDYHAPWVVGRLGDLTIKWEWMTDVTSPMEATCGNFSSVNPPALFSLCGEDMPNFNCCPPVPPPQVIVVNGCHPAGAVIPRTVVLPSQVLPLGGQFTSQAPYSLPVAIRDVSFYVKYVRGVPGGFPVVRLMWGNGFEETQSSIINATFATFDGKIATNQVRLNDLVGPIPDDDSPVWFLIDSPVPGGSTTARLLIAEGGVIGIPGTAEITLTGAPG